MNLLQKYLSDPDNYIIESAGGFGKSTQLKALVHRNKGRIRQQRTLTAEETFGSRVFR